MIALLLFYVFKQYAAEVAQNLCVGAMTASNFQQAHRICYEHMHCSRLTTEQHEKCIIHARVIMQSHCLTWQMGDACLMFSHSSPVLYQVSKRGSTYLALDLTSMRWQVLYHLCFLTRATSAHPRPDLHQQFHPFEHNTTAPLT